MQYYPSSRFGDNPMTTTRPIRLDNRRITATAISYTEPTTTTTDRSRIIGQSFDFDPWGIRSSSSNTDQTTDDNTMSVIISTAQTRTFKTQPTLSNHQQRLRESDDNRRLTLTTTTTPIPIVRHQQQSMTAPVWSTTSSSIDRQIATSSTRTTWTYSPPTSVGVRDNADRLRFEQRKLTTEIDDDDAIPDAIPQISPPEGNNDCLHHYKLHSCSFSGGCRAKDTSGTMLLHPKLSIIRVGFC